MWIFWKVVLLVTLDALDIPALIHKGKKLGFTSVQKKTEFLDKSSKFRTEVKPNIRSKLNVWIYKGKKKLKRKHFEKGLGTKKEVHCPFNPLIGPLKLTKLVAQWFSPYHIWYYSCSPPPPQLSTKLPRIRTRPLNQFLHVEEHTYYLLHFGLKKTGKT